MAIAAMIQLNPNVLEQLNMEAIIRLMLALNNGSFRNRFKNGRSEKPFTEP